MATLRKAGQAGDTKWLERRRRRFYCVKDIPLPLRKYFIDAEGKQKKRLVRSLETDDVEIARTRRHAALALFEAEFARVRAEHAVEAATANAQSWYDRIMADAAKAIPPEGIMRAALERREVLGRVERGEIADIHIDANAPLDPAGTPADKALSLVQWGIDDDADRVASEHGQGAADVFAGVARGTATPLEPFIDQWLAESDIEHRSKGDHRRAVKELLTWAESTNRQGTVEQFTQKVAGAYVSHLLQAGLDRSKTVSKRLWSLSSFWRFLIRKGHADGIPNPWLGHSIGGGRSARDKAPERPFTAAEVARLLEGPAEPVLADLMRLAFYSGARIEELCLLRVADIDTAEKTMRIQADPKSQASRRVVPIHTAVWPIIERRIEGRASDAFVLHELGASPKEGRQRSMAISKAFGRHRAAVGVDDKHEGQRRSLVNFHSFRRTFVTLCEQAGQPESTIRAVVGHKRAGMTFGLYSGGPSLEQRRACVESVKLNLKASL